MIRLKGRYGKRAFGTIKRTVLDHSKNLDFYPYILENLEFANSTPLLDRMQRKRVSGRMEKETTLALSASHLLVECVQSSGTFHVVQRGSTWSGDPPDKLAPPAKSSILVSWEKR